jgi:hypothetical protein
MQIGKNALSFNSQQLRSIHADNYSRPGTESPPIYLKDYSDGDSRLKSTINLVPLFKMLSTLILPPIPSMIDFTI